MKEKFEIKSANGSMYGELTYTKKTKGLCILVHGFKGFYSWGFFNHLKDRLLGRGIATIAFNFSHNGVKRHGNEISDFNLFRRNTFSKELEDFRALINFINSPVFPVEYEKLYMIAHSRGAFTGLVYASENPEKFDKMISLAGVSHYVDRYSREILDEYKKKGYAEFINGRTGDILKVDYSFQEDIERNRNRFDLLKQLNKIQSEILFLHGDQDETISYKELYSLYQSSNKKRTSYKLIKNAGHTFNYDRKSGLLNPELNEAINVSLNFLCYQWAR